MALKTNRTRLIRLVTVRAEVLLEVGTPIGPRALAAIFGFACRNSGAFTRTTAGRLLDHF